MLVTMNPSSTIADLFDLSDRAVLVTGASGGLGQRFARTLHSAGATLVLTGRDAEDPRLLALTDALGSRCRLESLDVRDDASVDALFERLATANVIVDVLVNNAGIATTEPALTLEQTDWDAVVDTNLRGPWLMAQAFARVLTEAGQGGSLINIASILGSRAGKGTVAYASAKAGLLHLSRCLALEWARHDIRVNTLSPGYILTDLNREFFASAAGEAVIKRVPQRRIGTADDLDGALLLLASDASRYMTGSDIVVDGGHLCSAL